MLKFSDACLQMEQSVYFVCVCVRARSRMRVCRLIQPSNPPKPAY